MQIEITETGAAGNRGLLLLLAAVNFLVLLDVTIINVALPAIGREFTGGGAALQWLVSGYTLTYALGLLPAGRLGDRFGPRTILLAGLGGFALGSLLCGMAPSMVWLQIGRVAQGIGAAMVSPQAMAIAHRMFKGPDRAGAFAIFGLVAGLASVLGPLVGGWLVSADLFGLGWRPIFLINPPLAVLLVFVLRHRIAAIRGDARVHFDPAAVALSALGLLCVLIPLIEGRRFGWPVWAWAMLLAALPVFGALIWWERRRGRAGRTQLLPLALLGQGAFRWYVPAVGLFFAGLPGFFMILALFLQTGFGFSPLQSGVTAFPLSLGIMLASILTPALTRVSPQLRVALGGALLLVGLGLVRSLIRGFDGVADQPWLMGGLLVAGIGFGLAVGPLFHLALERVTEAEAGIASALLQTFQQIGSALGVAVMGSLFFSRLDAGLGWTTAFAAGTLGAILCFAGFLALFVYRWLRGGARQSQIG